MIKGVKVFDTVLDSLKRKDTVSRNSSGFWREFCKSANWAFSHERVHSLADLDYFFSRKIDENIIIFSGHGEKDGFHLTNKDIFTPDKISVLPDKNKGKTIIFSSCLLAKNHELCMGFKEFFGAERLFGYKTVVDDQFCFLNESLLLSMIEINRKNFGYDQFLEFQEKTEFLRALNKKRYKNHPMVMF